MTDDDAATQPQTPQTPVPLTKAEKLEAKAAKLREREATRAAAPAPAGKGTTSEAALITGIVIGAVLVCLIVVAVLFAVHERNRADRYRADLKIEGLRTSALKTATTVSASFGTYDYKTLNADFARTRSYLTPSFAANFSKLTDSLGALITQDKGQTVGTVQGAGIQSINSSTAVVLVFLDQKVTSADSTTPRLDHNRIRLTLARQPDGKWLVSKLELV